MQELNTAWMQKDGEPVLVHADDILSKMADGYVQVKAPVTPASQSTSKESN